MDITDGEVKELLAIDAALLDYNYNGQQLDPLEKELIHDDQKVLATEVEEQLHAEAIWRKKWRKRPEDLDKLVHSKSSEVVICVAKVGRREDVWKLLSDCDSRVRLVARVEYEAQREAKQRREGLL